MPEFAEFSKHEVVPVTFHDVTVQVTYDPSLLTADLFAEAEEYVATQQQLLLLQRAQEARAGSATTGKAKLASKIEVNPDAKPFAALRYMLSKAIKAWDLKENGQPFSFTVLDLCRVPTEFLQRASTEMRSNERPKAASGGSFDDS